MSAYITDAEFTGARTGIKTDDLAAGQLTKYIQRASALIEQYCGVSFVQQSSILELLYTDGAGRAKIANNGLVSLYPIRAYPITAVASLTWKFRGVSLAGQQSTSATTTQTITSSDYLIEPDNWNEGWRVRIWQDFGRYRGPGSVIEFSLTHSGGYASGSEPDWLKEANIQWTTHLLKARGAQAVVLEGTGAVVDPSQVGSHLAKAREALEGHVRRF